MSNAEFVPAAWYPDRQDPTRLRWWDGQGWTNDVRPRSELAPEPAQPTEAAPVDEFAAAAAAEVAAVADIEPEAPKLQAPQLLQTRRGINAVAQPAQGFGHASPEQLRSWAPPYFEERQEIPIPVSEFPRDWKRQPGRALKAAPPVPTPVEEPSFAVDSVPHVAPEVELSDSLDADTASSNPVFASSSDAVSASSSNPVSASSPDPVFSDSSNPLFDSLNPLFDSLVPVDSGARGPWVPWSLDENEPLSDGLMDRDAAAPAPEPSEPFAAEVPAEPFAYEPPAEDLRPFSYDPPAPLVESFSYDPPAEELNSFSYDPPAEVVESFSYGPPAEELEQSWPSYERPAEQFFSEGPFTEQPVAEQPVAERFEIPTDDPITEPASEPFAAFAASSEPFADEPFYQEQFASPAPEPEPSSVPEPDLEPEQVPEPVPVPMPMQLLDPEPEQLLDREPEPEPDPDPQAFEDGEPSFAEPQHPVDAPQEPVFMTRRQLRELHGPLTTMDLRSE